MSIAFKELQIPELRLVKSSLPEAVNPIIQFRLAATGEIVTVEPRGVRPEYYRRTFLKLSRQVGSRPLARALLEMGVTHRAQAFQPDILAQLKPAHVSKIFEMHIRALTGNNKFTL